MATEKEIKQQIKLALKEVGAIIPWYDKEVSCWIFSHPLYPTVECGGGSSDEVKRNYPKFLREFIEERLADNLAEFVEEQTKGRGGARPGAGRPRKEHRLITKSLRLTEPVADVAKWLRQHPEAMREVQSLMKKYA